MSASETKVLPVVLLAMALAAAPVAGQPLPPSSGAAVAGLDPAQMFAGADRLLAAGRGADAETLLRALTDDPDCAVRNEARFRIARGVDPGCPVDEADGVVVDDGFSGAFCGVDRDAVVVEIGADERVVVDVDSKALVGGPLAVFPLTLPLEFAPSSTPRSERFVLEGVPDLLSGGVAPWTLRVSRTPE